MENDFEIIYSEDFLLYTDQSGSDFWPAQSLKIIYPPQKISWKSDWNLSAEYGEEFSSIDLIGSGFTSEFSPTMITSGPLESSTFKIKIQSHFFHETDFCRTSMNKESCIVRSKENCEPIEVGDSIGMTLLNRTAGFCVWRATIPLFDYPKSFMNPRVKTLARRSFLNEDIYLLLRFQKIKTFSLINIVETKPEIIIYHSWTELKVSRFTFTMLSSLETTANQKSGQPNISKNEKHINTVFCVA